MNNKKSFGSALAKGALGVAVTCLFAGTALAHDEATQIVSPAPATKVTMQKQVRFNDLDLSTEQGRAKLNERVRFAASDVCDGKSVQMSRSAVDYLDCYSIAMRDARQQLNQRLASAESSTVSAVR